MTQDIVLICLDSVRKDVFDDAAVRTQDLADVSFDNCRAPSSWSAPSHASMVSGLLPSEHEVTTHSRSFDSLPREDTLFDDLDGYRTVGVSGNVYAGPTYGFDRFFDSFFVVNRENRFPRALSPTADGYDMSVSGLSSFLADALADDRTVKSVLNGFSAFLDSATDVGPRTFDEGAKPGLRLAREELERADRPTFVFLNLMEGHIPYRPVRYLDADLYDVPDGWTSDEKGVWELFDEEYDERYWDRRDQLYRATVDYLDRRIAAFVDSVDEETTVVVTADHGDNLGTAVDGGLANHKSSLSEGVLHVPFHIVNAPDECEQTGAHLSQLAIPELITGLSDGRVPDVTSDRIVAELGGMSAGPDPDGDDEYYDRAIRCAYDGTEKVVWDSLGECRKYRIAPTTDNYQEQVGGPDRPPSWATDAFGTDLTAFKSAVAEDGDDVDVDASTAQRLEELGYL